MSSSSNYFNHNQNIQNELDNSKDTEDTSSENNNDNDKPSISDELHELAQIEKEGIITEELQEMKEE